MTLSFVPTRALPGSPSERSAWHWRVLLSSVLVLGLSFVLEPSSPASKGAAYLHNVCHNFGNFECPLCGGTRAFILCSSSSFRDALFLSPFAVLFWAWTVCQVVLRTSVLCRPRNEYLERFLTRCDRLGLVAFLPLMFVCWAAKFWLNAATNV